MKLDFQIWHYKIQNEAYHETYGTSNSLRENTSTSTEAKDYCPTYKKFLQINNKTINNQGKRQQPSRK